VLQQIETDRISMTSLAAALSLKWNAIVAIISIESSSNSVIQVMSHTSFSHRNVSGSISALMELRRSTDLDEPERFCPAGVPISEVFAAWHVMHLQLFGDLLRSNASRISIRNGHDRLRKPSQTLQSNQ
jgi:hypothetical protein